MRMMKANGLVVLDGDVTENRGMILRIRLAKIRIGQGLFNFGDLFQRPFSNGPSHLWALYL